MNRENKLSQFIFITLIIVYGLISCNTTEPPDKTSLQLTLEDVSCTEAWITLTTNNLQLPATINLLSDNTITKTINLQTADTLLYIDSLLPNQTYNFKLSGIGNPASGINSNELRVTTMDTTSHNFTWQTFTFGDIGNSVLFDVAIISENNIWCVGEIRIADNSPSGYTIYNAIHWDGVEWKLKRIMFKTICGQQSSENSYPASSIIAFSENEIWVAQRGDQIAKVVNGTQTQTFCMPWTFTINKIWGTSGNDLYVVGNNGNIAHYNGSQWRKIESGTDVDLKDIYGTPDGKELWTCGWSNQSGRVSVSFIKNNSVESLWDSQTNRTLNTYSGTLVNSLWANGNSEFVLVGGQVLRHSLLDISIVRREWIPLSNGQAVLQLGNYAYRIKGSNKNNIAAAGDAAMIWHYNGQSWHKFEEIYNQEDRLYGLAVTDNLIVAVGKRYDNGPFGGGLLIIGRR